MAKQEVRSLSWSKRLRLSLEPLEDRQLLSGMNLPGNLQVVFPTPQGLASFGAVVQSGNAPQAVVPSTSRGTPQLAAAGNQIPMGQNGVPASSALGQDIPQPDSTNEAAGPDPATAGGKAKAADQTPGDSVQELYQVPTDQHALALAAQYLAEQLYQNPAANQQSLVLVAPEYPRLADASTRDSQPPVDPSTLRNGQTADPRRTAEAALPGDTKRGAQRAATPIVGGEPVLEENWFVLLASPQHGEPTSLGETLDDQPEGALWPPPATWAALLAPLKDPVLAGLQSLDLATLEDGARKFLATLDDLGQYLTDPQLAARATPWLLALLGGAAAAWDYARRRRNQRNPHWPAPKGGWIDPGRTWVPGLALVRPPEESDGCGTP